MTEPFALTFSPECKDYIVQQYKKHNFIVEYGSGGSTLLAAEKADCTVFSVESSKNWIRQLMALYQERSLPGTIVPLYANVGATGDWGYPTTYEKALSFHKYATLPWSHIENKGVTPDLVLIDGRFRVSCFIASCIQTKSSVTLLFDDYVERPEYHVVEEIAKPITTIGNRMAVFEIQPNMVQASFLLKHIAYFFNPA